MSESTDAPTYKVGKVIQRRSLHDMARELEKRWTGQKREAQSLRELATYFNKELLRSVLGESDQQYRRGEIDHIFEGLTRDNVSVGEQTRIRKQLERSGIDVESLQKDFVTHQAIHTYLTKGRDVTKDTGSADRVKQGSETINRLRSRLNAVTETTLTQLAENDAVTLGSCNVIVDVNVHCTDCGTTKSVSELLDDGGCDCE